jgi:hypothetical protein
MKARGIVSLLVLVGPLAAGCDDVSPLKYEPQSRDADVPDHLDLGQVAACRSCATDVGATCRPARDSCQAADPRCGELLDCLTETNCWRQLNVQNFADPPPCALGCLGNAHVTSINEIGVPATQFYLCIFDPARCAPACLGEMPAGARDL